MSLDGEIALVTGASRGIGAAIAQALQEAGASVIGTATSQAGAEAIAARSPDMRGMVLDVADSACVEALFSRLGESGSMPGIVVNNAGITRDGLLARMSEADWDAVINTNLSSLYRVCKAAARNLMRARKGRIINITSVVGQTGNPGQSNYAAAKAGVMGFTRALARELAGRGITVNSVAPGFIDTDMTRELSQTQRDALAEQIPLKRLGTPEDVAAAVLFLASPAASYITGETINVNGGLYMP